MERREITSRYNEVNQKLEGVYADMHKAYVRSLKIGLTPGQAGHVILIGFGNQFSKTGTGQQDLARIRAGTYNRFDPSASSKKQQRLVNPSPANAYQAAPVVKRVK